MDMIDILHVTHDNVDDIARRVEEESEVLRKRLEHAEANNGMYVLGCLSDDAKEMMSKYWDHIKSEMGFETDEELNAYINSEIGIAVKSYSDHMVRTLKEAQS